MQPEKCINTYDETYVSRPLKVIIHNEQLSGLEGVAFQQFCIRFLFSSTASWNIAVAMQALT